MGFIWNGHCGGSLCGGIERKAPAGQDCIGSLLGGEQWFVAHAAFFFPLQGEQYIEDKRSAHGVALACDYCLILSRQNQRQGSVFFGLGGSIGGLATRFSLCFSLFPFSFSALHRLFLFFPVSDWLGGKNGFDRKRREKWEISRNWGKGGESQCLAGRALARCFFFFVKEECVPIDMPARFLID